jgi:hypothetical protein
MVEVFEFVSFPRLRVGEIRPGRGDSGGSIFMDWTSPTGEWIGELHVDAGSIGHFQDKGTKIDLILSGVVIAIWDWEETIDREEFSAEQLWEDFGLSPEPDKSDVNESGSPNPDPTPEF